MKTTLTRLEAVKDLVQEAIDKGATSVEQIHQAIAALPFTALEKRGLLKEPAEKLREAQAQTVGQIYEAIRRVNREVGELATGLFESLDDHADAQRNLGRPSREDMSEALDEAVSSKAGTSKRKGSCRNT